MGQTRRWTARLVLGLFAVSMLSGLVIVLAYHPSQAFDSVQKITYLIPYGDLFRQLHYFSSELLFVGLLIHIALELSRRALSGDISPWTYSVIGMLAVVLLMFSGFVLKGDQGADAASQVAFHLMGETPLFERLLPLVRDMDVFYGKFFAWHIILLPLLLAFAIYMHIDRITAKAQYTIAAIGISMLWVVFVSMPSDIVPNQKADQLRGPWFFWGAENLLEWEVSSVWVVLIMTIPFVLMLLYPFVRRKMILTTLLTAWLMAYAAISIMV